MNCNLNIAVVGAGVIGANTIIHIQQKFPNTQITLIDDNFSRKTLSYGPAGIFRPGTQFGGVSEDIVREWIEYSFQYYNDLMLFPDAGVVPLKGYIFSDISECNVQNTFLESLVPVYRDVSGKELKPFGYSWKYGSYFETIRTNCMKFIPWAINKFTEAGGRLRKCRIRKFTDLEKEFNVVFNCTGFAAKSMFSDRHMVPIRGQLITVHAPWITKFYYNDFSTFVVPLGDGNVVLGSTKSYENYDTQVDDLDTISIRKRCTALVPSVKEATLINQWVGLRPHRHIVRLEIEKNSKLIIVHNYGHGGYGITTAPGTVYHMSNEFYKFHCRSSKL